MNKQQTHVIILCDANGMTIDFERLTLKKWQNCVKKYMVFFRDYMSKCGWFMRDTFDNVARIQCISTPDGYSHDKIVFDVSKAEFLKMVEKMEG